MKVFIYGANGYTGQLIVKEALSQGLEITVAGRNADEIMKLAKADNLAYEVFSLEDTEKLNEVLLKHEVVIHCAGPFIYTALPMVNACIQTKTHYLDITGEYEIFEKLHALSNDIKKANIMVMPGAGFDVVPSDCLATKLNSKLPNADSLQLAFTSTGGGLSRGTAKTMIEGSHEGQRYRHKSKLATKPLASSTLNVDYGEFKQPSVGISWGDIVTAYISTGIPNIEVFTGSTEKQIGQMKWMGRLSFLLKQKWIKKILKNQIDKKRPGPSLEKRINGKMYLWGKISYENESVEMRLTTPNGYSLTAKTAVLIAGKIIKGDYKIGYQTPSMAYGSNLILEVEGTSFS